MQRRDEASILHADLDSFFASVEVRDDPSLAGKPVIVGPGVVLAATYEAKRCGVRSAMGLKQALRLCPQAIVVPARFSAYTEASRAVFEVFEDTTPLVEGISIDEAFLDVGGLRRIAGPPTQIAADLRRKVRDRVGLPITVGVASTKYLAKVASAVGKPDGLLVVEPGTELDFLHPLPVERLWGVGPVTSEKLHGRGIHTVGDLAAVGGSALASIVGPSAGRHLHHLAWNRDPRRVRVGVRRRSIGAQRALGWRPKTLADIDTTLLGLVERVTRRMRDARRVGRTVTLRLRFDDSTRATRAHSLPMATAQTAVILDAVRTLLRDAAPLIAEKGCTLVGLAVSNLDDDRAIQLTLPFDQRESRQLDTALDDLRQRFGSDAVQRAVHLGRSTGLAMPTLPDPGPTAKAS